MKDTRTTEYLEKLGKVKLSSDVKLRMRDEVSSYADFYTVRVDELPRSIVQVQRNSVFTLFTNSKLRIMKATLLIALLIGTGGTSFAAQGAVPGDLLYGVKVNVNENVRSSLALGADAEAQLQAEFLKERLEEAKVLAAVGKLEGQTAITVKANIQAQFQEMLIASTQANAQTEAAVRTSASASMSAFASDLKGSASADVDQSVVLDLTSIINAQMNSLLKATSSSSVGVEVGTGANTQSLINSAEVRIDGIKATLQNSANLGADAKADFEAEVQTSINYLGEASASLKTNAEADAKVKAESALEVILKVESALGAMTETKEDSSSEINLDLNGSGSVNGGVSKNSGNLDAQAALEGGANILQDNGIMNDEIKTQIDAALEATTNIDW